MLMEEYVGVYCLNKMCEILKKHILRKKEDTDNESMVLPCYKQYPHNAVECVRITDLTLNPPIQAVCKWVDMCILKA